MNQTYVHVGAPYAYPRASNGSYWETYKYYYPKDTELECYYSHKQYTDDNAIMYSWAGYVEGDRDSAEKHRLTFEGSDEYINSIYPEQNGVIYYNPDDHASYGLEGSTYDLNATVDDGSVDGDASSAQFKIKNKSNAAIKQHISYFFGKLAITSGSQDLLIPVLTLTNQKNAKRFENTDQAYAWLIATGRNQN